MAWSILSGRKPHWFIVMLSREELVDLLKEEDDFWPEVHYHGLQKYNIMQIVDRLREGISYEEMILEKVKFEVQAEEAVKSEKKK